MKTQFIEHIRNQLTANAEQLRHAFLHSANNNINTRHFYLDSLLPETYAQQIFSAFPKKENMREMKSFREHKYTYKQLNNADEILYDITFALQDEQIIDIVSKITEKTTQVSDPTLYAGGISLMAKDNFLNPHIDNSHEANTKNYRTLNLLYYVTPDWRTEYGGNLELWNTDVTKNIVIPSLFNRLVVMETTPYSWHSVSPVVHNGERCCVSNYYFSPLSPTGEKHFHVTSFSARPEQHFRRILSQVDNKLRMVLRHIKKSGFGQKDILKK